MQELSALHDVQVGSGVHPAFYPMGIEDHFLGLKREGREADDLPSTNVVLKNTWV
jgi:hypothetical protein